MSYKKERVRKERQRTARAALLADCFHEVDRQAAEKRSRYEATLKLLQERLEIRREGRMQSHEN